MRKFLTSKKVNAAIESGKKSKNRFLVAASNAASERLAQEQKLSQGNIDKLKSQRNVGLLERTIATNLNPKTGDQTKLLQAVQALSELQADGKYKGKALEDQKIMSRVKDLIKDDMYGDTAAGKYLKSKYN